MKRQTTKTWLLILGALSFSSSWASASLIFPTRIQEKYTLACVPACTLCHRDNLGGSGTLNAKFGNLQISNNNKGGSDVAAMFAAFDKIEAAATDTDTDGTPDIAELRQGRDPNTAGDATLCGSSNVEPQYGCGAKIASGGAGAGAAAFALLLGATAWFRLRRRYQG